MIDHYSFGRIVVDGQTYQSDVLIFPGRVDASWWRVKGHELAVADLANVLAVPPQALVVGTGRYGRLVVLPETEQMLAAQGVHLVVLPTKAACEAFNKMVAAGQYVVAALHLTC
jgi:hypothetical protein